MIGTCLKKCTPAILLGLFCLLSTATIHAEEDKTAQVEKLFREGVDLYNQGRYSEAQIKLKAVLALEPRKELAARLVDEAGTRIMAKMMADPRMGNEPTYIWQYYRQYQVKKFADKERMVKMAARLVDGATAEEERMLLYREFGELGHYAVPALAPYLKNQTHEDHRTFARIAIARMGSRAVLPVIELLGHADELMRQNAVLILSDIQPLDPRAIPALKARVEDAKETEAVKRVAARALQRITGMEAAGLKTAGAYYHDLANRYYLDRAGVAEEGQEVDGQVWHLNAAGDLVTAQYPLWSWNDQMAEENVLRGLAVDPANTSFFALWACVMAAQITEVSDLLDIVGEQPAQHNFSAEEKAEIEAWSKKLVDAKRHVAAVGKENCNAALNKVHADVKRNPGHVRLPQVGAYLARELAALDTTGELLAAGEPAAPALTAPPAPARPTPTPIQTSAGAPNVVPPPPPVAAADPAAGAPGAAPAAPAAPKDPSALVAGLDSTEEVIQYACALTLASIDRFPATWPGSDKVAAILGRGVSENKAMQVLLVEENPNTSNELREKLEALGYGVTAAISGRNAVAQARAFPPKDIAIISDSLRRDLNADQLMEELRSDVNTRYLQVGILHTRADRTLVQSRFGEVTLVEREAAGNDLKTAVDAIAAKRAAESVPKRKAHETAVACATALSKVDPRDTHLILYDAVEHAYNALLNRKDDVRIPAAIFLGRVEGGAKKAEAAEKLKAVVMDSANAVELRRAALRSLGRVQKDGLEDVYRKVQADPDQEIKDIGAESYGQISRANGSIIDFIRENRIDKDKKEK